MGSAVLPTDSQARKDIPIVSGVLDYFPAALAAVAAVSKAGNDKHNPGEPLHWSRGKSTDQADSLVRHLLERGTIDPDTGMRHSALVAWRALALLQVELEEAGEAPVARGAKAEVDHTKVYEYPRSAPPGRTGRGGRGPQPQPTPDGPDDDDDDLDYGFGDIT